MITINRDMRGNIEPNFNYHEFYCHSINPPYEHPFDERIASVLQKVREYYTNKHWKIAIVITSSYRPWWGNLLAGGVQNSLHLKGKAVDWKFTGQDAPKAAADYRDQVRNQRYLFRKMRSMGITSFGLYETFNHIDTGDPEEKRNNSSEDQYGYFSKWDKTSGDSADEQLHDVRKFKGGLILAGVALILVWR